MVEEIICLSLFEITVLIHFAMMSIIKKSQEVRCYFGLMVTCDESVWVSLAVRALVHGEALWSASNRGNMWDFFMHCWVLLS